ncbi:hypothetical protein Q4511_15155 [Paracoccus sp. 1_MG-2023]|uniref:hypothetical protein n=1 Tax=unclassified Paracoccus (in: a-proteobacteria) TaxID=2688777 RepID=UPI001C09D748|nr:MULTISPECIES: hypothetical protein [unclassified Paracoccus (in: a-proteobacteria)]MBU2958876.1 hypothetical protein [Paracoccus sp. C2R09]MDO6670262.1 hypothetical protein [Paracoccus sp. 1_MG-2023]
MRKFPKFVALLGGMALGMFGAPAVAATGAAPERTEMSETCLSVKASDDARVVCADLAAIDQTLVYNRFGSFNPFGMIFVLNRDIAPLEPAVAADGVIDLSLDEPLAAGDCQTLLGTETRAAGTGLSAGNVRLRDCKRPRPMVLRVNVGDTLVVHVRNLLAPSQAPDFSRDFCDRADPTADIGRERVRASVAEGDAQLVAHGEASCDTQPSSDAPEDRASPPDWPRTRGVNLVVQGLVPVAMPGKDAPDPACYGTDMVEPGDDFHCRYRVLQEGTYFFASLAAPAGGEGNGGSLVHGLFGAVVAQKPGSRWYRSQVTSAALDAVWNATGTVPNRTRQGGPDYEGTDDAGTGVPILNMAMPVDGTAQADFNDAGAVEIVHGDLNAIIYCDSSAPGADCAPALQGQPVDAGTVEPAYTSFREFSVFFHDELKTFYTKNFRELGQFGQLAGVKDGFAINYGASGMGSILLANRKGIGPGDDCMECLYEEFFLSSWVNGDPALLEWYPDDPSNVHHSYLNDPVVFRNFHAGPKETHVFHLHAHQWFAGNDPNRGSYLDSQTVGPQQGFTYNIYHGGLRGPGDTGQGWWDSQGSGNRNRTVGDSIFHCHLYPHFAQGMWALWRVHDALEDGTRLMPDGQAHDGLSVDFTPVADRAAARAGSVDPTTGEWMNAQEGTPIPALVPLPGEPIPLAPTYAVAADMDADSGELLSDAPTPMPGYPFYIAAEPGHRPPQAPLDIARNLGEFADASAAEDLRRDGDASGLFEAAGEWLDGGLNRHVVSAGSERELGIRLPEVISDPAIFEALSPERQVDAMRQVIAKAFALGDLSGKMNRAVIKLRDPLGERLEQAAMGFHHDGERYGPDGGALRLARADGTAVTQQQNGGYDTGLATAPGAQPDRPPVFYVNGAAPRPGAPFADPCGRWIPDAKADAVTDPLTGSWLGDPFLGDGAVAGYRRYEASAVQLDMIVNRAGWHDPQARINVLSTESDRFKAGPGLISPLISDSEEPFFFRALSGECIEFRHTNELPKELELDDFQVRTPTDTIGQHIHLVKFDVTSSDGSGNGWNYEDGTFAPDEVAARLCAWDKTGNPQAAAIMADLEAAIAGTLSVAPQFEADFGDSFCTSPVVEEHRIWRLPRSLFPYLFQTTTQRWFADPILSNDEKGKAIDRTMRTVFTHDHFGPSSIQQHGFYSALVVEPPARTGVAGDPDRKPLLQAVCDFDAAGPDCATPLDPADAATTVAWGGEQWEGTRKLIRTGLGDPEHPSYREFAMSIADFALLYDPRSRNDAQQLVRAMQDPTGAMDAGLGGLEGMAKIYCEARHRLSPFNMEAACNTGFQREGPGLSFFYPGDPPAWIAGGLNRDDIHRSRYQGDMLAGQPDGTNEVRALLEHLVSYRQKAGGTFDPDRPVFPLGVPQPGRMAGPVAAPERPESISVDHHDPYLVNYRGAPLPLRIADTDGGPDRSADCAPLQLNRPGEHGESDATRALADGMFGTCSYSHQMTGEIGDAGNALHSGVHQDPETPVLEAFAGERLAFRLVQGAQEVQHTFVLSGQPFKRNIDQAFPQGARPLVDAAAPSLQNRCQQLAQIVQGRPGSYRQWLDTAPSNREDPPWDADNIAYWKAFETALANCDNIEGFNFAQEIGISEHFEMQGSLRADIGASVESALLGASGGLDDQAQDGTPKTSSDYLYHFGSVDALWNGAWGLVRIFRDGTAPDPATVPGLNSVEVGPAVPISTRLRGNVRGAEGAAALPGIPAGSGLACPYPTEGGPVQRVVDAAMVAFETRRVFDPKGTIYADGVYDPDGLMLALMSPNDLGINDIADDSSWKALTADKVIADIQRVHGTQPEPFVLRVRAGDCLRLRVVNLLGGPDGAMRDLIGDAILPRIVPLNADPIPELHEGSDNGKRLRLAALPDADNRGGVRPSASLALSLGLPSLDLVRDVPKGYGYNLSALPGGNGGVETSRLMVSYAGRSRLDFDDENDAQTVLANHAIAILNAPEGPLATLLSGVTGGDSGPLIVVPHTEEGAALASVLGHDFDLMAPQALTGGVLGADPAVLEPMLAEGCAADRDCPSAEQLHTEIAAHVQSALWQAAHEVTHWIPYAFGPVPVVPTGDVISQTVHGLFGVIDVVPANWQPAGTGGLSCADHPVEGYEYCEASHVPGLGDGQGMLYQVPRDDGDPVNLREFVLFYQDGLNHWDDASTLAVNWEGEGDRPARDGDGRLLRIVPDCIVCDDSYDRGEAAVSQRSPAFSRMLRQASPDTPIDESDDLNAHVFPPRFALSDAGQLKLEACTDEQVVIRVVHPGGRARQRAFVMNGHSYDDLFPGFGFPRSALLAPGKTMTAWLRPAAVQGTYVWHDGPTHIRAGGVWGLLDIADKDAARCAER